MTRTSIEDRFFSFVDQGGPLAAHRPDLGHCWLWTGSRNGHGYPQFWRGGTVISGRKAAWEIAAGERAPNGLHFEVFACGVQDCVNPAHVRPIIAVEPRIEGGAVVRVRRWLAALYARRVEESDDDAVCVEGHPLVFRNRVVVPGGLGCRTCRREGEKVSRRRGGVSDRL